MSIINQTLRDLDARKTDSDAFLASARPVPALRSSRRGVWIALALLLPVAGLAVWFGLNFSPTAGPASGEAGAIVAVPVLEPTPAEPVPASVTLPGAVPVAPPLPAAAIAAPKAADVPLQQAKEKGPTIAQQAQPPRSTAELPGGVLSMEQKLSNVRSLVEGKAIAISREVRKTTPEEDAEDRYRKALSLVDKGRENQARPLLEEAVKLFPGHVAARQVLATLLNEAGMNREAEAALREGRIASPDNAWFALSLARLQMARGDLEGAAATMRDGIEGRGVNADYRATYAALLSRLKRHAEAANQYELALRQQTDQGTWWMGLGLALAAQGKSGDARAAYGRALAAGNLSEKLEDFVRAKLAE